MQSAPNPDIAVRYASVRRVLDSVAGSSDPGYYRLERCVVLGCGGSGSSTVERIRVTIRLLSQTHFVFSIRSCRSKPVSFIALDKLMPRAWSVWLSVMRSDGSTPSLTDIAAVANNGNQKEPPQFEVVKRFKDVNPVSGQRKYRTLHMPNLPMWRIHKVFSQALREAFSPVFRRVINAEWVSPCVCGGVPGKDTRANILPHLRHRYFYLLDIEGAFPNTNRELLERPLKAVWPADELAQFLASYCLTEQGGLPIGSPSSGDLFNICFSFWVDTALQYFCHSEDIRYTRYLDDLTFSSNRPITARQRRFIREVIGYAEFKIADRKSKVLDLCKGSIVITGIGLQWVGVDSPARLFLPRHTLRRICGLLHQAINGVRVKPQLIRGYFGLFLATLNNRNIYQWGGMNETERRVARLFAQWRFARVEEKWYGGRLQAVQERIRVEAEKRRCGLARRRYWRNGRHRRWLRQQEATKRAELVLAGLMPPKNQREFRLLQQQRSDDCLAYLYAEWTST